MFSFPQVGAQILDFRLQKKLGGCLPPYWIRAVRFKNRAAEKAALARRLHPHRDKQAGNCGDDNDKTCGPVKNRAPFLSLQPPRGTARRFFSVARHETMVARRWTQATIFDRENGSRAFKSTGSGTSRSDWAFKQQGAEVWHRLRFCV
jgi:hypothetical protein